MRKVWRKSQYRKYKHWFKKLWKDRKTYVNGEKQKNLRLNDHSILQKRWIQHYIKSSSRLIPLLINKLEFFIFKLIDEMVDNNFENVIANITVSGDGSW